LLVAAVKMVGLVLIKPAAAHQDTLDHFVIQKLIIV
jgi:hypothetical protein